MMFLRQESEYLRAKWKAARKICRGWVKPSDLPSNAEIRDEIQRFTWMYEGDSRTADLREMRLAAYRLMRRLQAFKPRLIGSTLTGHVRQGSDIDIHLFVTHVDSITAILDDLGLTYRVERKCVRKHNVERIFTHVHVQDRFPIELTCYTPEESRIVFKSSITGKAIERAGLKQLAEFLQQEYPDADLEAEVVAAEMKLDPYLVFRALLLPLAKVEQSRQWHPEGDVLYHSLQVYDFAADELPYDEEFLQAALLHDIGKGIDPSDHVQAGIEALQGYITPRTEWLIANHMEAQKVLDHTIGARAQRRLQTHEDYEELITLARCDRAGRVPGLTVPDLDEVLDQLRELAAYCG